MKSSVFKKTTFALAVALVSGNTVHAANLCRAWKANTAYAQGTTVIYNSHVWKPLQNIPASNTHAPGEDTLWVAWPDTLFEVLCQEIPEKDTTAAFDDTTRAPLGVVGKWKEEEKQTSRCELATGTDEQLGCLLPEQFRDAEIHLPRNITRVSKSAFRLCPLPGSQARNAVVYVMDHSTSMGHSDHDPTGISGNAFKQAMQRQYELDSSSYIGYIPFSQRVIASKTVPLTRVDNGGIDLVKSQVDATWISGTNFYEPLSLAQQWLSAPELDGYNKFIIFMADGEPIYDSTCVGNSNSTCPNRSGSAEISEQLYRLARKGVLMHTIYFGSEDLTEKGPKLMDSLAKLAVDAVTGEHGQFNKVQDIDAMTTVMDALVQASVKSASPLELKVRNKTTGHEVGVDQSRMKQLVDGTWISVMTSDLAVEFGVNEMELVGRYQNAANATTIPFEIRVDSTYSNENRQIEGTPFTTSCHELTKLTILDEQAKNVFIFDQTDTVALVRFRPDDRSYGVSLEFSVLAAATHDTLTVTAPLVSTPQGWLYQARVPLDWTGSALADARLQVADLDSFLVSWEHPDDPQDHIEATQRVLWQLARPDSVALHDVDHDGVLDELKLCFSPAVDSASLAPFRMEFAWIAANGTDTALVQWKDSQKNVSWSADSTCALWALDQSRYAPYTGIPQDDEDWMIHMVLPSQNPAWIDDLDGGAELVVDEMAPVILSANLHVNQTRSKPDTLRIQFSEPIDWNASGDGPLFDFQAGGLLFPALEYDEFSAGRSSFDILYYSGMDADFPVQNGDLVKMVVGDVRITDFAGNSAWKHNPWVTIAGGSHQNVKIVPEVVRVDGDIDSGDEWPQSDNGSKGAFSAIPYDNADEAFEAAKARGNIKVVWGPITFAEPALGEPAPKLSWSVWIFDNIGQYVDDYSGVLDCGAPEIAGRCYTEEGLAERFAWNFRDKHGRLVGAGVYRMRITIGDEVRNFEIGVVRAGK